MSYVSKKEAAPALPGGPRLLPAQQTHLTAGMGEAPCPDMMPIQATREEAVQGQAGESLDLTLAGESKGGESPILFFQCSSQQEEQDRRLPPAPD